VPERIRGLAVRVALAGWNQIFGLDDTQLVDAGHLYLDAPPDAPPMCADPSQMPKFDRELHQSVYADLNCHLYQTSTIGLALAQCAPIATNEQRIYEGSVGPIGDMAIARGDLGQADIIYSMALAPEGSEVFVARYDVVDAAGVWRYQRDAAGVWHRMEKTPITFAAGQKISTVTRGPLRHLFVLESNTLVREWALDASGTWNAVAQYSSSTDLGTPNLFHMNLSADGLRLLIYGRDMNNYVNIVLYGYRATIAEKFSKSIQIPGAPLADDLYLTGDCDRVYFSGLSAVFYVRRLP
jgi:hypothetical protein